LYRSLLPAQANGMFSNFLPGLSAGAFSVVVCRDCGLTRLYAIRAAANELPNSDQWERVDE